MSARKKNLGKFINNLLGNVEPETTQSVLSDIFGRSKVIWIRRSWLTPTACFV